MCGIAGLVRLKGDKQIDAETVRAMADTLIHRGPDDSGVYVDPNTRACGLGFRRLSIIDLSTGHQPLANEDESVWVAFNGEIYNFQELRSTLERQGHRFATHSDTEVLVHLWEQQGTEMVRFLRGMFAFAIWDCKQQSLFLARDRLGQKPLFYGQHDGLFRFGSELKVILSDSRFPRQVDPEALLLYLTFGYVPHPWSILSDAKKLPPAHWALIHNGNVQLQAYWTPPAKADYKGTFDDACSELRERLIEATRLRMIADVPLGAFLSGGIDSTIIVGLMSQINSTPVKTFSIGFDEERFDETEYARVVAKRFNTDHQEHFVRPDAIEILPLLAHHYDEPFADSSAIPTYYVSKMTRQNVTVALTGDAGDEAFGGYRRYLAGQISGWVDRIPLVNSLASTDTGRLIPGSTDPRRFFGRLKRLLTSFSLPAAQRYFGQMSQISPTLMDKLLHPDFVAQVDRKQPISWFSKLGRDNGKDRVRSCMDNDYQAYLPCDILTKVDIASMAVSLECRSPFLDHHLVELACRIPTNWRLRGFTHKYILKQTFADVIPPQITQRRKMGFGVPLIEWFRGPLESVLRDVLLSPEARQRNYLNIDFVKRLIDQHVQRQRDNSAELWTLLMLEQWHRKWAP